MEPRSLVCVLGARSTTKLQFQPFVYFLKDLFLLYTYVYLHVCSCTTCVPGAQECHNRASDSLEPELQVVVSHLGAEDPVQCS